MIHDYMIRINLYNSYRLILVICIKNLIITHYHIMSFLIYSMMSISSYLFIIGKVILNVLFDAGLLLYCKVFVLRIYTLFE